ncbi:MAG: Nif3-like dinuclear metal center hexameric protein [Bacteroidia bacterium]|nr:Nif3-like dinuclear metal center hexameric protein [Bacteroidia bacterium]
MLKLSTILQHLEELAPPSLQESYDNAGLLTGSPDMDITGAIVCLDSTEAVLDEAIAHGCNLVIAHHPIVFSGLKRLTGRNYIERTIIKAIRNNIAIYAIHTNLDNVREGVNARFAEKLGLQNTRILQPQQGKLRKLVTFVPYAQAAQVREALFQAGAGNIGNYSDCSFNSTGEGTFKGGKDTQPFAGKAETPHTEPETRIETIFPQWKEQKVMQALRQSHPYEEIAYDIYTLDNQYDNIGAGLIGELQESMNTEAFLDHLKKSMKAPVVRHTELVTPHIKTVAICGGSGSFLLNDAIRQRADIFITGDFKYHQFFDADGKIIIADIGHFESEQFTIDLLTEYIRQKFTTFAVRFTETNTNPIYYR